MAVTNETTPFKHHSVWHKVIYEASSTNASQNEFKYVFKIIGLPDTRIIKVSPRPGDGWGFIDARRHLQDGLNVDQFDIEETDIQVAPFFNYSMKIDEEYKDGSGNLVEVPGPTFGGVGLNYILNRNDILTELEYEYILIDSEIGPILWNIPNKTRVKKDDLFFIYMAISGTSGTLRFVVTEYFNTGLTNVIVQSLSVVRANYKTLDLASVLTDPDNTTHIEVKFQSVTSVDVCEPKTLILEDHCTIYRKHRIIYLDSMGSYSSLNFDYVSRKETEVKPKTYEKFINGATETSTSRPLTRYFVESKEVFTVNTGIMTDKHNVMLQDLIKSTRVFLDVRNDDRFPAPSVKFVPIEILTPKLKELKSENQELNQQTIRYRYSYDDVTR